MALERDIAGVALLEILVARADHPLDQAALRRSLRGARQDLAAVAEDGHRVGDAQDVVEKVRDEDDAAAAVAQAPQNAEQALDLGRRERGGGLVEDDDARARKEHARDLDELLQADRQVADALVRIDVDPERGELLPRAARAMRRQRTTPKRFVGCLPRKTFSATVRSGAMLSS